MYGNQNQDTYQLYINIKDVGDMPPKWQKYQSTYTLKENTTDIVSEA